MYNASINFIMRPIAKNGRFFMFVFYSLAYFVKCGCFF